MTNKTCGECKLSRPSGKDNWVKCSKKYNDLKLSAAPQCKTPYISNGDVIRQGGNRDFSEYFVYETGAVFASTLIVDKTFDTYEEAVKSTEDYLNAPADCVTQNDNHDTQTDLCKADNTESGGGKDE